MTSKNRIILQSVVLAICLTALIVCVCYNTIWLAILDSLLLIYNSVTLGMTIESVIIERKIDKMQKSLEEFSAKIAMSEENEPFSEFKPGERK